MLLVSVFVTSMMYLGPETYLRCQSFYKDDSLVNISMSCFAFGNACVPTASSLIHV